MMFMVYEDYLAGQQANAEKASQFQEKALEAELKLRALLTEWELTMAESFKSSKDVSAAIEKLDEQIDKAKREMERAARERDVFSRVKREVNVTADDVIAAWNSEFNPQYYDKEIAPVLEQLEATKKAHLEAMRNYFDKVHAIQDFREEVSNQLGFEFPYRFHIKELTRTDEFDRYFIKQSDMNEAQQRR